MEQSKAVCLRLITNNFSAEHHCSLCLFLQGDDNDCQHTKPGTTTTLLQRTTTPFSECSFYTCRTAATKISLASLRSYSSGSSTSTIKAADQKQQQQQQQTLRRRQSPTEYSLRELNHRQASTEVGVVDLRTRQSEEELQAVYERQILQYLNTDFGIGLGLEHTELWTIEE